PRRRPRDPGRERIGFLEPVAAIGPEARKGERGRCGRRAAMSCGSVEIDSCLLSAGWRVGADGNAREVRGAPAFRVAGGCCGGSGCWRWLWGRRGWDGRRIRRLIETWSLDLGRGDRVSGVACR